MTFKPGDKVIIDMSGAGKGYPFSEIISQEDDKHYNIKDYGKINSYYIRHASEKDFKLKALYDSMKIEEFDAGDEEAARTFWRSQKDTLKKSRDFINNFAYIYLTEKNHILTFEEMIDWDSKYKKAMHTKNEYIFVVKHDIFKIMVMATSTFVSLYILLPKDKDAISSDADDYFLTIHNMAVEYSDDEYVENLKKACEIIVSEYESRVKKEAYWYYYYMSNHAECEIDEMLKYYKLVLEPKEYYDLPVNQGLPGREYTRALFDLKVIRHYFFNSNFNFG